MEPFTVRSEDIELRRDLIRDGWTDRDIAYAVRRGELSKVRYGAYVRSSLIQGLDEVALARVRSRAVLLRASPCAVLSHQSACAEYGVPIWGLDLSRTHLTRTDRRAGRSEAGVTQHRAVLPDDDWTERDGLRVVSLPRAVLEVIVSSSAEVGLVTASLAMNSGQVDAEELRAMEAATDRWPRSLTARLVLARSDDRLSSVAEARCWHLFHRQRVPLPIPQVDVYDERGNLLGIVDFAWAELGVFLEFDGKVKYERYRRPGESLNEYLMREKRREELICQVTGWTCIRLQWSDLGTPERTARRILGVLLQRAKPVA